MPDDKTPQTSRSDAPKPDASKPGASDNAPGLKDFKPRKDSPKPSAGKSGAPKSAKSKPAKPSRRQGSGVSFPVAAGMAVLAAFAGAAGGWILPKIFDPANAAPAQAITQNAQALKAMQQSVDGLKTSQSSLRKDLGGVAQTVSNRTGQAAQIIALEADVSGLKSVDINAERAAALDPVTARIDALETLITPEGEETGVASQLLGRLDALETRLEALLATPPVSKEPIILSYSTTPGESGPGLEDPQITPADAAEVYDLVAQFPREAMLSALSVQSQNIKEPSWLRRIIGKHIETDDLSVADARKTIDQAQALTARGDVAGAVTLIETLNPTLRAAAHSWMIEAKKAIK